MKNRYFTKSAYKLAIDCPTKLYYCCDKRYANQDEDNEFLKSLADGGFQVGELARIYYHIEKDNFVESKDYEDSLKKTEKLFCEENVNIAEAAFRYRNLFVRADIIEKKGNHINLIEVKAKSCQSTNGIILSKEDVSKNNLGHYIKDVAFQKYVIQSALKEQYPDISFTVHAFLMMADKSTIASVNGMNQCFKINGAGHIENICVMPGAQSLDEAEHVLTAFDVDIYCEQLISETHFESDIEKWADAYCNHTKIDSALSHNCFKCQFTSPDDSLFDGYKECWGKKSLIKKDDFDQPSLRDFSMSGFWKATDKLIADNKVLLREITAKEIRNDSKKATNPSITDANRREILFGFETGNEAVLSKYGEAIVNGEYYLDKEKVKKWLANCKGALHFIDFETATSALPFYKGMRPYEPIAFQYSHHTVSLNDDGTYEIEHTNQFLNTEKGHFPNFDFIRSLKASLSKDNGPIFRYSNHENTILRSIRSQLKESQEPDAAELIAFIDKITHSCNKEVEKHTGDRDMIDMEIMVKECFLHPREMKGRTSIKVVLPAVLNSSKFLQDKYSNPIYGTEIRSCNYSGADQAITWVNKVPGCDKIDNPYHQLEKIEEEILTYSGISDEEYSALKKELGETVENGGAALSAYSKLQYTEGNATEALKNSLFRYCELDTMAMVFIWEFFYNEIKG